MCAFFYHTPARDTVIDKDATRKLRTAISGELLEETRRIFGHDLPTPANYRLIDINATRKALPSDNLNKIHLMAIRRKSDYNN